MTPVLERWNSLDTELAVREVLPCCGSCAWAGALAEARPFASWEDLFRASNRVWCGLPASDWQEAFDSHPRIGEQHAQAATAESLAWSSAEQSALHCDEDAVKLALAAGNREYEQRFGHIFIVCASGKSAGEILGLLRMRVKRTATEEWLEAGEQQRQITQLRLQRWMEAK